MMAEGIRWISGTLGWDFGVGNRRGKGGVFEFEMSIEFDAQS